jgi:hypothetical protein
MPPKNKPQLSPAELATLVDWVERGAGAAAKNALALPLPAASGVSANAEPAPAQPTAESSGTSANAAAGALPAASAPSAPSEAERASLPDAGPAAASNAVVHGSGCAGCTLDAARDRSDGIALGFSLLVACALFRRSRSARQAACARSQT